MKLKGIIKQLEKKDFSEFRFDTFRCTLNNGIRLVHENITGGSSGGENIHVLIAHNRDGIKDSVKIEPYNDKSNDWEIFLKFLKKFEKQGIEKFNLTLRMNKPKSTEVWIYKQRNCINALTYNTKIEDSLIID